LFRAFKKSANLIE
jgi:hypothetical protein